MKNGAKTLRISLAMHLRGWGHQPFVCSPLANCGKRSSKNRQNHWEHLHAVGIPLAFFTYSRRGGARISFIPSNSLCSIMNVAKPFPSSSPHKLLLDGPQRIAPNTKILPPGQVRFYPQIRLPWCICIPARMALLSDSYAKQCARVDGTLLKSDKRNQTSPIIDTC